MTTRLAAAALLILATLPAAPAAGLTAFAARDLAAKKVTEPYQKSLISAEGKRSAVSRDPVEWVFFFYDPTAVKEGLRIVVSGTAVTDVREGYTQIDRARLVAFKPTEVLPHAQLKVDSDEALGRIMSQSALKNYRATASSFKLSKDPESGAPVWEIRAWAQVQGETVLVALGHVHAGTGQILDLSARPEDAELPSKWQKFQDLFKRQ